MYKRQVQAAVAMLAPMLGMKQTYDISDDDARTDLSRVAVMVLSFAAQSALRHGRAAGAARPCRSARSTRAPRSPSAS